MRFLPTFTFCCVLLAALIGGCDTSEDVVGSDPEMHALQFTFDQDMGDWAGAFADYSESMSSADMNLVFDRRPLPDGVDAEGEALFLAGTNHSDDLFMYLKREVTGLAPNTTYALTYRLRLASNAPSGCVGIGGPPGEAVWLKAGAARTEPERIVEDGHYRLNVDKGNQSSGGDDAQVLGTIGNGVNECTETPYRMITRTNEDDPFVLTTDDEGALWLLVGTDSGFEGRTALYYDTIEVTLEPR